MKMKKSPILRSITKSLIVIITIDTSANHCIRRSKRRGRRSEKPKNMDKRKVGRRDYKIKQLAEYRKRSGKVTEGEVRIEVDF